MTPYYDAGDNLWYDDAPTRQELANDARIDGEEAADRESFDEHYGEWVDNPDFPFASTEWDEPEPEASAPVVDQLSLFLARCVEDCVNGDSL